jgi:hypothetical protein
MTMPDECWLLDTQTFEEIGVTMPLSVAFLEGQPIRIEFQEVIDARIAFTFPPDHYMAFRKRATLENGVEVSVPLSVQAGDIIRVHIDSLTALHPLKRTDK